MKKVCRILALILLFVMCFSYTSAEKEYEVNGKDLDYLSTRELLDLFEAIKGALANRFIQDRILAPDGRYLYSLVIDESSGAVHASYCPLVFMMNKEDRFITLVTLSILDNEDKFPCQICHPEQYAKY